MLTENVHTQNDKMVVNMMVQLHAPSMQVLVKQSQLCRNFWVAGHKAGSGSVCVRIVKVMEVQWPESSHSAYILDGWFAGATSLKHKVIPMKINVRRCSLL